jgi:hypothetical protein
VNEQRKTKQRKTKGVQFASPSDPGVPQPKVENGVQAVPPGMGSKIPPVAEGKAELACVTPAAAIQTERGFVTVRSSDGQGGAKTVASLEEYHVEGLVARAEEIDAQYAGGVIEDCDLPQPIIDTAQQWLRAHNLIWSSNDLAFWAALEYVLGSLESFSIDAVEQALVICTTEAFDDAARRSTIYQELRACRALKKIRDMQLQIRTAQVVATRTLSASYALAVKQKAERTSEVSRAYVVFVPRENYETKRSEPYQKFTDAQRQVQRLMADPNRAADGYWHPPAIHQMGLNAVGEQIKDYGVVNK